MATKAKNLALAAASKIDSLGNVEADTLDTLDSLDFYAYDNSSNPILSSVTLNDAIDELSTYVATTRETFTATAGQTTFAVDYTVGAVDVYLNGFKLQSGVDFTASNGTSIVLTEAAALGDIVDITAQGGFSLANHYTKTEIENHNLITVDTNGQIQGLTASSTTTGTLSVTGTSGFSGVSTFNNKVNLTHTGTMGGAVNLSNYFFKIGDGSTNLYFDTNEIVTDSANLHLASIQTDGKIAFQTGLADNYRMVIYDNGIHIKGNGYEPTLAGPTSTAALEVGGSGSGWNGGYNYAYTRHTNSGIGVYGNESAIEIAGNDSGNHGASLHLRAGDEGFSLINDPVENSMWVKTFTAGGDGFSVHAGGTNATVVNAIKVNKNGQVNFPVRSAFTVYRLDTATTNNTYPMTAVTGYFSDAINTIHVDNNGDFDLTNKKFIAPQAGLYHFTFNMSLSGTDGTKDDNSVGFGFNVNGVQVGWGDPGYTSALAMSQSTTYFTETGAAELASPSMTAILSLNAGDEVQLWWDNLSKPLTLRTLIFTGFLLA